MSRAGSRTRRYRPGYGRMGDKSLAWLSTLVTGKLTLAAFKEKEQIDTETDTDVAQVIGEPGTSFVLLIPYPGRPKNPLIWNFSHMTQDELDKTRQFFDTIFALAEPVVIQRDKAAADAEKAGDDSFGRIYRDNARLVARKGAFDEYGESLLLGFEGPPSRFRSE